MTLAAPGRFSPLRLRKGRRLLAVAASLAIHLLVALLLIRSPPSSLASRSAAQTPSVVPGESAAISVTLVPASPRLASAEAEAVVAEAPMHQRAFAPSPALGQAPAAEVRPAVSDQPSSATDLTAQSGAPGASAGAASPAGTTSDFRERVLEQVERNKRYPPGGDGSNAKVQVLFTLTRSGAVAGAWVQTSSGSSLFDREALATLMRSQPLPAIPPGLPDRMNFSFYLDFTRSLASASN